MILPHTGLPLGPLGFAERPLRRDPATDITGKEIYQSSPEQRVQTVQAAFESGIRFFHAAHEHEASSLGVALRTLGIRDQIALCTTEGDALDRCPDTEAGGETAIRNALQRKLELLGVSSIDAFLLYDFRAETHTAAKLTGARRALEIARNEGRIRFSGATCYGDYAALAAAISAQAFPTDLVIARYNYWDTQAADQLLPVCREHQIDTLAAQPFAWIGGVPFVRFPNTWRYRNLTKNFYGFTAGQAHLHWIANQHRWDGIVVSMQTPDQIHENCAAMAITKTPTGLESLFASFVEAITKTREGWLGLRQDEEWEYRLAAEKYLSRVE